MRVLLQDGARDSVCQPVEGLVRQLVAPGLDREAARVSLDLLLEPGWNGLLDVGPLEPDERLRGLDARP
jgi:hypothetical protein